jgi:hypothetical protein
MLISKHIEDENRQNQREKYGRRIEDAAQPLPSLALRIEKNLFIRHEWPGLSWCENGLRQKPLKQSTLYSTNRMEADSTSQFRTRRWAFIPSAPVLSVSLALAAGLALRLWMLMKYFLVNGDSLIYGEMGKNLLLHGQYALTGVGGRLNPTLIRLPGYPFFLALCFRGFGMENYASAAWVQIALELAGCLLLADFAGRIAPAVLRRSGLTGCGKRSLELQEASGHDFSRAVSATKQTSGFSPCGMLFRNFTRIQAFFRSLLSHGAGFSRGAAHATLWLAALCPFTAIYAAEPMPEALTLFMIALALWSAARFRERPAWGPALCFTFAVTYAALLRPDGALVAVALAPALFIVLLRTDSGCPTTDPGCPTLAASLFLRLGWDRSLPRKTPCPIPAVILSEAQRSRRPRLLYFCRKGGKPAIEESPKVARAVGAVVISPALQRGVGETNHFPESRRDGAYASRSSNRAARLIRMAVVCTLLALAPFTAWTLRNWQVFHVFQPLAPRYANDPGQETYPGWQRWVRTWSLDFVSTYNVYWEVPGASLDLAKLPSRAFDSPAQYEETAALASDYNDRDEAKDIVPDVDARFGKLADERIAAHPLRYYLWLPLGRVADMGLRPRVENMDIDLDWWVYAHHRAETRLSWAYAGLNALYLLLAAAGLCLRPRFGPWMAAYMVLRSALLMTVEAPEARYTLECFPMLFALGGVAVCWCWKRTAGHFRFLN